MSGDEDAAEHAYHVRRQRRSVTTLVVVLGILAAAFYYASTYFRDSQPKAGPCTTLVAVTELRPADISLNVYNATKQRGLAREVGAVVTSRGFKLKAVANDPLKKTIKGVAELRHGPDGLESAKVVQKHLPGSVLVADKRQGDTVDLVIGNGFRKFGPVPPLATPTVTAVPCPPSTALQ